MENNNNTYGERVYTTFNTKEPSNFIIYKYESIGEDYLLYYFTDCKGEAIHFTDPVKHHKYFSDIMHVSAQWKNGVGVCTPIIRYSGTIKCINCNSMGNISDSAEQNTFKISRRFLSRQTRIIFKSKYVGEFSLRCKKVIFQKPNQSVLQSFRGILGSLQIYGLEE